MLRDFLNHLRRGDPTATITAAFLVLVVAGFAVYASSFGNHLFWDDDDFFLKNTYVHDWSYFPKFFSENVISGSSILSNYWRPMLLTVFALEWHLWGAWAPGWHVTNTCFHITNAFLLFLLLFHLFRRREPTPHRAGGSGTGLAPHRDGGSGTGLAPHRDGGSGAWVALLAALAFLLHPVQTEAVSYANSLGDSLSVFFILGSLLFYLSARKSQASFQFLRFSASLAFYVFALLSKETAIILPGLIFLVELFHPVHATLRKNVLSALHRFAPFAILALGYVALRATVLNFQNSFNLYNSANVFTSSIWVRLLTFCRSLVTYITLIFWPAELHMERSVPFVTALSNPLTILGALLSIQIPRLPQPQPQVQHQLIQHLLKQFLTLPVRSRQYHPSNERCPPQILWSPWLKN